MRRLLAAPVLLLAPLAAPADDAPGPLVIVGGGKVPDAARKAFVELAGKDKARVVVVPTASALADDPKGRESFLEPWRDLKPAAVGWLHTRDPKAADDPAFAAALADATGVWFAGGDQSRITAAYRGTRVEKELKKLHARGGVVGGTSAGAAVMTDPMITGGRDVATTGPGLGFLPGCVVDQHFFARNRQRRLAGVVAADPGRLGIGIDEGTAVVVRGGVAEVVGAGRVAFYDAAAAGFFRDYLPLRAGEKYDLAARARVEK